MPEPSQSLPGAPCGDLRMRWIPHDTLLQPRRSACANNRRWLRVDESAAGFRPRRGRRSWPAALERALQPGSPLRVL